MEKSSGYEIKRPASDEDPHPGRKSDWGKKKQLHFKRQGGGGSHEQGMGR